MNAAKQHLMQIGIIDNDVQAMVEERDQLVALLTRVTPSMSDEPKGRSSTVHKMDNIYARIDELDDRINKAIEVRTPIIDSINDVPDPIERQILVRRYVFGWKFQKIADSMYYAHRETICRKHGEALNSYTKSHPEVLL